MTACWQAEKASGTERNAKEAVSGASACSMDRDCADVECCLFAPKVMHVHFPENFSNAGCSSSPKVKMVHMMEWNVTARRRRHYPRQTY